MVLVKSSSFKKEISLKQEGFLYKSPAHWFRIHDQVLAFWVIAFVNEMILACV